MHKDTERGDRTRHRSRTPSLMWWRIPLVISSIHTSICTSTCFILLQPKTINFSIPVTMTPPHQDYSIEPCLHSKIPIHLYTAGRTSTIVISVITDQTTECNMIVYAWVAAILQYILHILTYYVSYICRYSTLLDISSLLCWIFVWFWRTFFFFICD